jgi:hypothetical protein
MFGTFFIKSDHSLGVFLLLLIAIILYRRDEVKGIVKAPGLAVVYLLVTLFMTESNISKLLAVILVVTTVIVPIYHKYGQNIFFRIGVGLLVVVLCLTGYSLKDEAFIQRRLGGSFTEQFSLERAERYYELGTAKRFQIVMVAAKKLDAKWIGDGPYSYFSIRTGKFSKAPHFSQLLWTYFDLGVLGLLIVLAFLWNITRQLYLNKGLITTFFFGILLLFAFYTTILSDVAILLAAFSLLGKPPGKFQERQIEQVQAD